MTVKLLCDGQNLGCQEYIYVSVRELRQLANTRGGMGIQGWRYDCGEDFCPSCWVEEDLRRNQIDPEYEAAQAERPETT